jgi:hypothetical protein
MTRIWSDELASIAFVIYSRLLRESGVAVESQKVQIATQVAVPSMDVSVVRLQMDDL